MAATMPSLRWSTKSSRLFYDDPYAPTLDRDVVMAQFLLDKPAVLNADVLANGYGHIDAEKMQRTIDIMAQAYEITENLPTAADMFTNEFLPSMDALTPKE
jgi:hypothetical protein